MTIVGIDIGGHFSKAGLVQNGKIIYKTQTPTTINNEKSFFDTIFRLVDDIIKNTGIEISKLDGIGIAAAGMVLAKEGKLLSAVNLGLKNIDVVNVISTEVERSPLTHPLDKKNIAQLFSTSCYVNRDPSTALGMT